MSVPVRCYSVDTLNNNQQKNIDISSNTIMDDDDEMLTKVQVSDEMQQNRRMFVEGRLGTPDATDNVNNNHHHHNHNTNNHQLENCSDDDGAKSLALQQHQQSSSSLSVATSTMTQQQQQPTPESALSFDQLLAKLSELLALEPKFQPNLYLPQQSCNGEITIGTRDGAAHVLRCLKVWYELPNDVLFAAINLVDRFLTKMKVRPKHMACISVSSFHLAVQQLNLPLIDTEDLVAISQCRCTSRDLVRMSDIVANKLGVQIGSSPVTALTFIRLFYYLFENAANALGLSQTFKSAISLSDLEMRLEILACDASCASIRPSELALVMIFTQMDAHVSINNENGLYSQQIHDLVDYAIQLQKFCHIPDSSFFYSHSIVAKILSLYNGQHKMPYKQRLVWKLSSRTMRVLRPTDKLTSYLPTIAEHNAQNNSVNANLRFRTGSVSSEDDGEDWPTSPIVAVCEQCFDE
uniref:Putative cyclin g n=1 Tax=Corethrella appendiculata TaxID=1370023 RepID=U5ESQ7_9DIPT